MKKGNVQISSPNTFANRSAFLRVGIKQSINFTLNSFECKCSPEDVFI